MLNPSIGKLIKRYDSRYQLVLDIAKCARDLSDKSEQDGEPLTEKAVSTSIDLLANTEDIH